MEREPDGARAFQASVARVADALRYVSSVLSLA